MFSICSLKDSEFSCTAAKSHGTCLCRVVQSCVDGTASGERCVFTPQSCTVKPLEPKAVSGSNGLGEWQCIGFEKGLEALTLI